MLGLGGLPVGTGTSDDLATQRSFLHGALVGPRWSPPAPGSDDPFGSGTAVTARPAAASLERERARRRVLFGRLAAVFYAGSGLLGLVTLPLPAPTSNRLAVVLVSAVALAVGIAAWFVPWGRLPRRASLWLVPPGFAMIALANIFGGSDLRGYGVFFVVAFVWIGVAQRPHTSLAVAPLAVAAYLVPLAWMPGGIAAGLPSAATTIPLCLLVGEGIAWGMARLEQIEGALHVERARA